MRNTLTIARRELNSFFFSPIAYVVLCVFALLAGLMFMLSVLYAATPIAHMQPLFFWLVWILIAIVPAISMRLLAEEMRSGTVETLMTSPVTDLEVVLGKWLGGLAFFAVLLAPTLVYAILLEVWGEPDYGPLFTGYLGLILVGGLYMAIGTFASVMTRNQIIAFLLTVFIILMFTAVPYFLARPLDRLGPDPVLAGAANLTIAIAVAAAVGILAAIVVYTFTRSAPIGLAVGAGLLVVLLAIVMLLAALDPSGWARAALYLNVNEQFEKFNLGLLTSRNFIFFLTAIGLFLTLAVKALESRKWR